MGKNSAKRVKLGFFVSSALVVTMVAIYFIGARQHLFGNDFRISGSFADVGGLQVGNNVRFAGVNVGTVEAVTITSNHSVRIDMIISEEAHKFIKKDAIASVGSESMMGNKVVILSPGSEGEEQIANHDMIQTAVPISFDDILKHVSKTSENAAVISGNLAGLTSTIRTGTGTFGKMFMDKALAQDVSATVANLKEASASFKDLTDSAQKSWLLWGSGKSNSEKKREEAEKFEKERVQKQKAEKEKQGTPLRAG